MTRATGLLAATAAVATLLQAPLAALAAGRAVSDYEVLEVEFPERSTAHRLVDVDGDGKRDLVLAVELDAKGERFALRACLHASAPRFSRCFDLPLDPDVRGYDIGNVDASPASELVLVTRDGGALATWGTAGFAAPRPLALSSLLENSDPGRPLALGLLYDLDRDGRSELLLPTVAGPTLQRFGASGPSAPVVLTSPAQVRYRLGRRATELASASGREPVRRIATEATSPIVFVEDFDGDGRLDVVTATDNRLRVFAQRADGGFATEPTLDLERSVLSDDEEQADFSGEATSFADLDADGRADLVVLKWGSSQERTKMDRHVFFAREEGSYPDEADQVVRSESVFPDFEIVDLDRNGRLDLVIPYFHIAPSQAFKMVTQNTLRVQLRMFLLRDDGRFAQGEGKQFARVDRRVVIDYHFDVMRLLFGARHGGRGGPPEHFAPLITARGDFDGDGFPDLATDSGRDELHLRFGNANVEYAREPDLRIPFASSLAHDLVDVDGDGRSDVVSYLGAPAEGVAADARPQAELRRNTRPTTEPDGTAPDAAAAEPGTRIQLLLSR